MQIKSRISQISRYISQVFPVISQIKVPGAGKVQIKSRISQISRSISQVFPVISQIKSPGATKVQIKGGENITFSPPSLYLLVFSNERMMNVANCWRVTASSGP